MLRNAGCCTCTNSVHAVRLRPCFGAGALGAWDKPLVALSCEPEGHPLGGGMPKLEPRDATRVVLPSAETANDIHVESIVDALRTMGVWRHYGGGA